MKVYANLHVTGVFEAHAQIRCKLQYKKIGDCPPPWMLTPMRLARWRGAQCKCLDR